MPEIPSSKASEAGNIKLPGWNVPINHYDFGHGCIVEKCPTCGYKVPDPPVPPICDQASGFNLAATTCLEQEMLNFMNAITDKPRWHEKIHDPSIVERWRREALEQSKQRQEHIVPDPWQGTDGAGRTSHTATVGDEVEVSQRTLDADDVQAAGGEDEAGSSADTDSEDRGDLEERLEKETDEALELLEEHLFNLPPPMSDEVITFCIAELKHKADRFQRDGLVCARGTRGADIVKSDVAVPESFRATLAASAADLELNIEEDWHPGHEGQVRNLVHPSLYPLHFGQSTFKEERIPLEEATDHTGTGEVLGSMESLERGKSGLGSNTHDPPTRKGYYCEGEQRNIANALKGYSRHFQWLPAEVSLGNRPAEFTSYINNLDFHRFGKLYKLLGELVEYSLPLWQNCIAHSDADDAGARRQYVTDENDCWEEEIPDSGIPVPPPHFWWHSELNIRDEDEEKWVLEAWQERYRRFMRQPVWPTVGTFEEWIKVVKDGPQIDLRRNYNNIQVIVKLSNIELTPENPSYDGGSWHVEGKLCRSQLGSSNFIGLQNEHICATSIFYYDSDNITESRINFRCGSFLEEDDFKYCQDSFQGLERIYGSSLREESASIDLPSITTPQGRLLAFPNVFQHRVQPFTLADPTKPGHRKIAVLWLVNPQKPIISTAHVPPQQKEKRMTLLQTATMTTFPPEIADMIVEEAVGHLDTLEEAKQKRLILMEERRVPADNCAKIHASYNFCEH